MLLCIDPEWSDLPRTALAARLCGLKYYYTGDRCPYGHFGPRRATKMDCLYCHRERELIRHHELRGASPVSLPKRVKTSDGVRSAELRAEWALKRHRRSKAYSPAAMARLLANQRGRCALPTCRRRLKAGGYHRDHIKPLALGGSNRLRNIQLLCPGCNIAKGARDPIEFVQSLGLLI